MSNTDICLLTVNDCCTSGSISRTTFYRLAKKDPNFPGLVKIGGGTRVRSNEWRQYLHSLAAVNGEVA